MASVLGLALKISADATGIQQSLTPVERALKQLDTEAAKVTEVFKTFATASGGAGKAQQQFATDLAFLQSALRTGKVDGEQFAAEFAKISAEATKTAEAFREGATITAANRTEEEKRAEELARLNELLKLGAIEQETFNRASAEASGANKAAAAAAAEAAKTAAAADKTRADQATRAAAIVEANLTKEQKAQRDYGVATRELNALRKAGLLTEAEYSTALQRVSKDYAKATLAADKFAEEAKKGGDAGKLKFNELSGVLSALPGPIGNVAGRLSGLSSAGEGLGRVFAGGLNKGLASVSTQFTGLLTTTNLALVGVAAFGAAAVAVARGLVDLEDRVEKLGNTADKLGVSFEFIQTLEAAAARSGTSVESVSSAFGRLQKNITGVDEESKAAQAALKSIGVTSEELQALKPEDQYKLIGERLQAIEDPAKRTAASIQLFGKSGAELLPFFKNLGGASDDMERFGRALTDVDRKRIDDFGAGLDAFGVATEGLGQTLLLPFVGLGEGITKAFAEVVAGLTSIIDPIGQVLEPIFTQIGRVIELIGTNLGNLGRAIGVVLEPFGVIVQGIAQAFEPLNDAALNFFKAISDGAVAATEFVMSFTPVGLVADNMGVISETLSRIVTIITTAFAKAGQYVADLAGQFGELVASTPLLSTLGDVASAVFGTIATVIGNLASGIGEFVGNLLTIAEYWLDIEESTTKTAAATVAVSESTAEVSKEAQKAIEEREKTFQRLREEVNNAIDDSRKFGAAGREAAASYEASIEQLKKKLSSGLIDEEQFRRSVRIAGQDFDAEIKAIEQRTQLEIKVKENAEKAIEKVADQIDKAAIKAEDFGKAGDRALDQFAGRADSLKLQFSAGLIDEKQLEQGVAAANREYDKQIEKIKQANTERQKQIEDDRKRSESLLDEMDKTRAVQRDREAVERDVARLRSEAAAQGFFTPEQRKQLLDLQQLQGDLAEKQRAVAQGFEKGYAEAFDKTADKFDSLIVKSEEFGAAGQEAARRLADGLNNAARLAERGAIGEEAYNREVARQERLYEKEVEGLKKAADERLKVNEAVDQILLLQSVNGDSQRAEAKKQVLAIEQEIARVQEEIAAAREADDTEAVNAGAARLAQLDQAAAKERDIASGAAKQREDFQKQSEKQLENQNKAQQQYAQQQTKIFEEQQKAAAAEAKRQEERLEKLNTLGATTIKSQDVRTTEGASLVLQTIANGQDPALIQQRLQTKYLEVIAAGIGQASSNYFNSPVAIVGYSSFGQQR
jgi:hypothetical protein